MSPDNTLAKITQQSQELLETETSDVNKKKGIVFASQIDNLEQVNEGNGSTEHTKDNKTEEERSADRRL